MGQLGRVQLTGPDAPKSVIVKLPTSDPGGQVMGQMMRVWEREHQLAMHLHEITAETNDFNEMMAIAKRRTTGRVCVRMACSS